MQAGVLVTLPRLHDDLMLVATRPAINCAGLFVVSTLTRWRVQSILVDSVVEVERLVTNAVKQTGRMVDLPILTDVSRLNFITVRLLRLEHSVAIEVWDVEPDTPTQPPPRGSVMNRGSYLEAGGKVVWAELALYPNAGKLRLLKIIS